MAKIKRVFHFDVTTSKAGKSACGKKAINHPNLLWVDEYEDTTCLTCLRAFGMPYNMAVSVQKKHMKKQPAKDGSNVR